MSHQNELQWLLSEKYNNQKSDDYFADCKRLESGEPLAYIIGHIPFLGCTIYLDTKPLIPRPETEFWTEHAIKEIVKKEKAVVLDLCAGSGAIGVAVGSLTNAIVTFGEIDPVHTQTIQKNCEQNNLQPDRFSIITSDLYENINGTFDFILTNPPYIDAEAHTVDAEVVMFEPHQALFGGEGGLAIIEKIIESAHHYLNPLGQLWIEHEPFQSVSITQIGKKNGYHTITYNDQYHTKRYSVLTRDMTQ